MKMEYRTNRVKNEREILIIGPCSFNSDQLFNSLEDKLPIIAVDKGLDQVSNLDSCISIGDGDSSSRPMDYLHNKEKDYSDLRAALDFLGDSPRIVYLYGFLGQRKDHELINIGEVYSYVRRSNSTAHFENNLNILPAGLNNFKHSGTFSVISIIENQVTIKGQCSYKITSPQILRPLSSLGLSNEASGNVELEGTEPIIITTT